MDYMKNYITDIEKRIEFSKDYSLCESVIPEGIFFPETSEEISDIVKEAVKKQRTITVRGGGSGVVGGCIPSDVNTYVISLEKFNKIQIFENDFIARVDAGVNTLEFQNECRKFGLFFPPDPSSADISTIGGNIACGAGGMRGFRYGTVKDYILSVEFVDGQGNIVRAGTETLKRSAGYNLVNLICGSEGTLGIITEASFKLLPEPAWRKTLLIGFDTFRELISSFTEFMKNGIVPSNAEFIDANTLKVIKRFFPQEISSNSPCLLLEIDGISENTVNYQIEVIKKICNSNLVYEGIECEKAWSGRKKLRLELAKVKPNVFSEDFVLKYSCIADFIEYSENLLKSENICFYNFGHIIDGNIHFSVVFENSTEKQKLHDFIKILSSYVIKKGGTISGEHGIGLYKKDFLAEENINLVNYMKQIKKIFDPYNVLNRGKVI